MASKAAKKQLTDAMLDEFANSGRDFALLKELPATKQEIIFRSATFLERLRDNLIRLNKVSTGALSDGGRQGELIEDNWGYEIDLGYEKGGEGSAYYDFVNKGVKGTKSGPNSIYKFKSKYPSRAMVNAIKEWIDTNKIAGKKDDQKFNRSALQIKRDRLTKVDNSLAYAIATNIKQKGISQTRFFDEAIEYTFGKGFIDALTKSVGADVKVYIRQANLLINENNNK